MRVTNLTSRPQVLDDGTILAAAGTDGASKDVAELSDRDRKRLVDRGEVHMEASATARQAPPAEAGTVQPPAGSSSKRKTQDEGEK